MHAKPPVFSYKFQGIFNVFNASVFSELAVHTETKIIMIIFTSGLLQGFRLFSGKSARRK